MSPICRSMDGAGDCKSSMESIKLIIHLMDSRATGYELGSKLRGAHELEQLNSTSKTTKDTSLQYI